MAQRTMKHQHPADRKWLQNHQFLPSILKNLLYCYGVLMDNLQIFVPEKILAVWLSHQAAFMAIMLPQSEQSGLRTGLFPDGFQTQGTETELVPLIDDLW